MGVQVTKNAIKETLTPEPDSIIVDFQTSSAYKINTVSVWQNGIRLIQNWDDGFTEMGGTTIRFSEPPLFGDTLQVEYEIA
jgi:acyl dehydratase